MAEVDEMVDGLTVRLAPAEAVRARGERRRKRRRMALGAAAVVTAVALGAGSWAVLPGGGTREVAPAVTGPSVTASPAPTAPATPNPYYDAERDLVSAIDASKLPLYDKLHWSNDSHQTGTDTSNTLDSAGLDGACGTTSNGVREDDFEQFTTTFSSKDDAKATARHRLVKYDDASIAAKHATSEAAFLTDWCKLKRHGNGTSAYYAGTAAVGGQPLWVSVTQYGNWVSVIEVQNVAELTG